ncbi:hypothetical protein EZV62_017878 [Acer yangbiense]|uniref:Uncharacterized protein n=1 Tax=Acer yangbiense TaxID=1000413 RepID=A0A5C7HIH5_9ROSI|nr:hypothetical protein EZV62_017878 [Acer yangbiense]
MGKSKSKKAPGNPTDCSLSNNGGITAEGEKEKEEEEDASKFNVKSMPCSSNAIDDGDADSDKNFHIENQTMGGLGEASTSAQQDSFFCGMDNADNVKIQKQRNVQINPPDRPCTCTCSDSEENGTGIQEEEEPDFMELDTSLSRLRGIRFSNGGIEVDFLIV